MSLPLCDSAVINKHCTFLANRPHCALYPSSSEDLADMRIRMLSDIRSNARLLGNLLLGGQLVMDVRNAQVGWVLGVGIVHSA